MNLQFIFLLSRCVLFELRADKVHAVSSPRPHFFYTVSIVQTERTRRQVMVHRNRMGNGCV